MCWFSTGVGLQQHNWLLTHLQTVCAKPTSMFVYILRSDQTATFWGVEVQGPVTLKFELGRSFGTVHLPIKFCHPMFNRSEVIVLTNKQTNRQTSEHCWKHTPRSDVLRRWIITATNRLYVWLYSCANNHVHGHCTVHMYTLSQKQTYDLTSANVGRTSQFKEHFHC